MLSHVNKFTSILRTGLPLLLFAALAVSCSKESSGPLAGPGDRTEISDPALRKQILDKAKELPAVGIYNRTMDKVIVFRQFKSGKKSFSFVNPPGSGINFATSNGGQWVWTESGGLIIITEPSAGIGSGGGTVVAGNTVLDIGFAVCFSFDEEALGADLFDTGVNNVAGVVGIAGDFEALANGDFSEGDDLFEYFHGFAYYLVYTEQLGNQDYEVLNWIEDLDQSTSDLENFGFSFVVGFQDGGNMYQIGRASCRERVWVKV